MFELSVASKYLLPRWRQLSVSIISIISILVISLVVWLIVVFFSVTNGLEEIWVKKLVALTAPLRASPNENYYNSYYYQIDSISNASDYQFKTLDQKLLADGNDPYDPEIDEEVPFFWPAPHLNPDGSLKDLVNDTFRIFSGIPGVTAKTYEMTFSNFQLQLLRRTPYGGMSESTISNPAYIGSFDEENPQMGEVILSVSPQDIENLKLSLSSLAELSKNEIQHFFSEITINSLKTAQEGWVIPQNLYPPAGKIRALGGYANGKLIRVHLSKHSDRSDLEWKEGDLVFDQKKAVFFPEGAQSRHDLEKHPIILFDTEFPAALDPASVEKGNFESLAFDVKIPYQGLVFEGKTPFKRLETASFEITSRYYLGASGTKLPDTILGKGILLPKGFKDHGALIGDRGHLTVLSPSMGSLQEEKIPVYVAGFYDPGIIPIGGKFLLADKDLTSMIRASHQIGENSLSHGVNLRISDYRQADEVKADILKRMKEEGLDPYWNVQTYKEYDFTKDLLQELKSQKLLFTLISLVIIVVACSNIVSMLIILVNDKKIEIGILRSIGASSLSIATIFGICGIVMGTAGSVIGITAALFTLRNIQTLMKWIGYFQGKEILSSTFYGDILPQEISYEALAFVLIATACISLFAGIIPAIKACLLKPSAILRAE